MANCTITFFDQFLIALSTTILLVVLQLLFFFLHSYWERFCHAVEEVFSGASDAHEREGPCVHEALHALLEQRRVLGSGVVPMRPPRRRSRLVRRAN
ncbi:hypothetical protein TYRP_020164 [Tyrophagus putrescentiae]|nr:hypothetical protein TYRP_020164 [Tyrophagus putrescentiae]